MADELRVKGNESFKGKKYQEAIDYYSLALKEKGLAAEPQAVLLSNRAACWIKLDAFSACAEDCSKALELCPSSVKAMYRLALAQEKLSKDEECLRSLKVLLCLEPHNAEALELMRTVRGKLIKSGSSSGIQKILSSMAMEEAKSVLGGLQALLEVCKDDVHQSIEFIRRGGLQSLNAIIQKYFTSTDGDVLIYALRLLAVLTAHPMLVNKHVSIDADSIENLQITSTVHPDKLSLMGLCQLLESCVSKDPALVRSTLVSAMNILKATPAVSDMTAMDVESTAEVVPEFLLSGKAAEKVFQALLAVLRCQHPDTYIFATDTLSAFISDLPNYYEPDKLVDTRTESVEDRKKRFTRQRIFTARSKQHVDIALSMGCLDLFVTHVASEEFFVRSNAVSCFGKLIKYLDDDARIKDLLAAYLPATSDMEAVRKRAALEAALFVTHPELGAWAVNCPDGERQIAQLVASQDTRCIEIASEVLCLAAGVSECNTLLTNMISNQVIHTLLHSPYASIRAAAASVLTKLSLKAKALSEESQEVSDILNAVVGVLKAAARTHVDAPPAPPALVSFSHHDSVQKKTEHTVPTIDSSLERTIEVIAAIVGKTFVKEEVVHGSNRVISIVADLAALEVDPRSSAAYGIAHIFVNLTVTNRELKAIALAEKDMTIEQYDTMQELQRIKAKDEDGTVIEEKKEDPDLDTVALCKMRIRKIVSCNGLRALLRLVENGSLKTKETALRALRQICVDEQSRGLFIQQGGLKICSTIACEDTEKAIRYEAAHAVAKALVTTNPNVLSEHLRLASIRPLLFLCKESDATNLQQFEALLALTNVISVGSVEQEKFVTEKGVHAVHYLMFNNNLMLRRAATEALCNLSSHEALLKVLRAGDKLKLWLALAEDWSPNPDQCEHTGDDLKEAFLTARASAGTLAMAATDPEVVASMIQHDAANAIVSLLQTEQLELVHRALFIVHAMLSTEVAGVAMHLLQGGVVPAMAVVTKCGVQDLTDLAKECATLLSAALNESKDVSK